MTLRSAWAPALWRCAHEMNHDAIIFICLLVLAIVAQSVTHPTPIYLAGVAAIYLLRRLLERWGG